MGYRAQVSDAAADRLLTLPLDDREFGIFDNLPDGWPTSRDMADHLIMITASHHGVAMRAFLRRLVEDRAADEAALKRRIGKLMAEFRRRVGVNQNNGSAIRVADTFGLIFAAGKLAQRYGALPRELRCGRAALAAYELNRSTATDAPSMLDRLIKLAKTPGVITIDRKRPKKIDDKTLNAAPALLRTNAKGQLELLLTTAAMDRTFPVKRLLFADPDVAAIMICDSDNRKSVKRPLRAKHKDERVYCFTLPTGSI